MMESRDLKDAARKMLAKIPIEAKWCSVDMKFKTLCPATDYSGIAVHYDNVRGMSKENLDTWIREIFEEASKSCLYYAIATVNEGGSPNVTPIGTLFLRGDQTGFHIIRHIRDIRFESLEPVYLGEMNDSLR